jgi:TolB-like protein
MKKITLVSVILLNLMTIPLMAGENLSLAVLDFEANGVAAYIGKAVSSIMISALKVDSELVVIERAQIQSVIAEREFQKKNCTDEACAIDVGKLLSVNKVLVGSVTHLGEHYLITCKVVDVANGIVEAAENESCDELDDLDAAARYLAIKMLNQITANKYSLPSRAYETKEHNPPYYLTMGARYGMIVGLRVPHFKIPTQYPDKISLEYGEQDIQVAEALIASTFYISENFAFKAMFKYMQSVDDIMVFSPPNSSSGFSTTIAGAPGDVDGICRGDNVKMSAISAGLGIQFSEKISNFFPYFSGTLVVSRYIFEKSNEYMAISQNIAPYDSQDYSLKFANTATVFSGEAELGFFSMIVSKVGINFAIGADFPFAGKAFNDISVNLRYSDTDGGSIPLEYRDLQKKKYIFDQPMQPNYYVQLGLVLQIR